MKKILFAFSLSLALVFSGCDILHDIFCSIFGQASAPYIARYSDSFTRRGVLNSSGNISVPSRGFPCGSVIINVGRNFGLALTASPSSPYRHVVLIAGACLSAPDR